MKKILIALVIIALIGLIGGILISNNKGIEGEKVNADVKQFESYNQLLEYINNSNLGESYYGNLYRGGEMDGGIAPAMAMDSFAQESASANTKSAGGFASDYSRTNVQEEGVDEPDIVKNDGKYIYKTGEKSIYIISAYPSEEMDIISQIDINMSIINIFVNGDKLIVFANYYQYIPYPLIDVRGDDELAADSKMAAPYYYGYSKEENYVLIYDIRDRENPKMEKNFSVEGNYVDARMIGDIIYLISNKYIDPRVFSPPVYRVDGISKEIPLGDIYYFDYYDTGYNFNYISSINLNNYDIESKVYMIGYSSTIYVSENNIYLISGKTMSEKEYFNLYVQEVVYNIVDDSKKSEIDKIINSDDKLYEKNRALREFMIDHIDAMTNEEKEDFAIKSNEVMEKFYEKIENERQKTVINKINIDNGNINLDANGEVNGYVESQFSLSEYNGYLRVSTTSGQTWRENSENNLYVLDESLNVVGSVTGLAKGERIYSTRYIGDKAYMVTFRQVDPLFVIDLSDAKNPQVLGYLKVSGYSDYLHPYDETHLIGIGKEADENGRTQGLKISLFDVSDFANPKEVAKFEVQDGLWSDSNALYDHKSFLFNKEKNLLVIPVSYNEVIGKDERWGYDMYKYWNGIYVFNIDKDSIELKGKIDHSENESEYYYSSVSRSLYIENTLYSVSDLKIKANSLSDLSLVDYVDFPKVDYYYPYYKTFGTGIGLAEVSVASDVALE